MKKLNVLFQVSTISSVFLAGIFSFMLVHQADAQSNDEKLKVDIEVTENGKTRKITKELDAIDGEDIEAILESLDVLDDIDIRGTGERIEIKVKKEVAGKADDQRINVQIFGDEDEIHWHGSESDAKPRPLLGVYIDSFIEDGTEGALVTGLVEENAAELAGLEEGDLIIAVDKKKINSETELKKTIGKKKVGDEVVVKFLRDGIENTKKITLVEANNDFNLNHFHFNFDDEELQGQLEKLNNLDFDIDFDFDFEVDEDAAFLGVTPGEKTENGVSIGKVIEDSAADKMGLKSGDVVTELDGKTVTSFDDLASIIIAKKAGDKLNVSYLRDGKLSSASGELGKKDSMRYPTKIIQRKSDCTVGRPDFSNSEVVKEVTVVIELKDCTSEQQEMLEQPAEVNFKKDLALNKILFAPNPSDGQFNLTFELPKKQDTRVMVFDQVGRKVYEELLNNFSGRYSNQIDISSQPNGVYFLIIAQQDKQFTKKIVKQ